ncbi:glycosyltransferase [Luteimicrobium album]
MSLRTTLRPAVTAARRAKRSISAPVLRRLADAQPRTLSAMVRVRDEEEFLETALESIEPAVDEIVVVDNLSTDGTPEIIRRLREKYPAKVRAFTYPHTIARYGEENATLAASPGGMASPRLLANYYNWCLERCTQGFVLKWDGDMVATEALEVRAAEFRSSRLDIRHFLGVNLHPDRRHLVAGLRYEDPEPRFFVRRLAKYDNGFGVCERFTSPYEQAEVGRVDRVDEPLYVHLRYCKHDPSGHISPITAVQKVYDLSAGEPVSADVAATVARWHL